MPSQNNLTTCSSQACGDLLTSVAQTGVANIQLGTSVTASASSMGLVSGTTSTGYINNNLLNGTSVEVPNKFKFPKDGEIHIDSETLDSYIYFSDYGGWIICEIEGIKKQIDIDGEKMTIINVSFIENVHQMKKKEKERIVLTEKIQKEVLWNFSTCTSGFIHTIGGTNTVISPQWITYPSYLYGTTISNPYITTTINQELPLGITTANPMNFISINGGDSTNVASSIANINYSI